MIWIYLITSDNQLINLVAIWEDEFSFIHWKLLARYYKRISRKEWALIISSSSREQAHHSVGKNWVERNTIGVSYKSISRPFFKFSFVVIDVLFNFIINKYYSIDHNKPIKMNLSSHFRGFRVAAFLSLFNFGKGSHMPIRALE